MRKSQAQRDLLDARARRKKQAAPTAEELARLAKSGDPSCPKGQAYKPKESKLEIRCTGPQLVDMPSEDLKAYYGERRFKVTSQESPAEVRAELGSELYVFSFDKLTDGAPRCVTAYAQPGMSWQEVAARLTGMQPERLKLDAGGDASPPNRGTARSGRGPLELKVEHAEDKPTVYLGKCGK